MPSACAGTLPWQESAERSYRAAAEHPEDGRILAQAGGYRLLHGHDPAGARNWLLAALERGAKVELALGHLGLLTRDYELLARAIAGADPSRHTPDEVEALVGIAGLLWGKDARAGATPPDAVATLERVAAPGDTALEAARTEARLQLAAAAWTRGDDPAFRAALTRAGVVSQWRLCAPCQADDLIARPLGARERARQGFHLREVATWQSRSAELAQDLVDLGPEGGTGLAEAWVALPEGAEPRELVARLESDVPAWLYVGGQPVVSVLNGDASTRRQRAVHLAVPAGPIRLLVEARSPGDRARFNLVVSHPQGLAIDLAAPAVAVNQAVQVLGYPEGYPARFEVLPPNPSPEEIIQAFHALDAWLHPPLRDPARAAWALHGLEGALSGGERPYPGLELARARLAAYDPELPSRIAAGRRRKALEAALAAWPTALGPLLDLAELEIDEDRLDAALERLQAVYRLAPEQPEPLAGLARVYEKRGWTAELRLAAADLEALGAAGPMPLQAAVGAYRSLLAPARALEVANRLEAEYPARAQLLLATLAADAGQNQGATARLRRLWDAHPDDQDAIQGLTSALRAAGELPGARGVIDAVLARRPDYAWALAEKLGIELQANNDAAALDALRRLSIARPGAPGPERLAAWLAGDEGLAGGLPDTLARLPAWRDEVARLGWEGFPAVTLSTTSLWRVRADGGVLSLTHVVRLVQRKAAADEQGELRVPQGAELLRLRTIRPDGRVLWPEMVQGKPDISFSGLEPGDVMEWAWVMADRVAPEEGGYLSGLSFSDWEIPILQGGGSALVEAPLALDHRETHGAPAPTREEVGGGWVRHTWHMNHRPSFPREPHAVSARGFFPYADLRVAGPGATDDASAWRAIVLEYAQRIERLIREGPAVLGAAREIAARTAPESLERVREAYEHIQRGLKMGESFNSFDSSGEQALAGGRGNRTLALLAVARALGLDPDVLLCAPTPAGPLPDRDRPLPNANRFFYPVLRFAEAPGMLVDPAEAYGTFGMLPEILAGAGCVGVLGPSLGVFSTLDRAIPTGKGWSFEITVSGPPGGDGVLSVRGEGFGPESANLRRVLASEGLTRVRQLWQRWLVGLWEGVGLRDANGGEPTDTDTPLGVSVDARLAGLWTADGERWRASSPIPPMVAGFFASVPELADLVLLAKRVTPLRIPSHRERVSWTFQSPPGYRVSSRLRDVQYTLEGSVRAGQTIVRFEGGLRVERWIELLPSRIEPAAYQGLRAGLSSLLAELAEPVWLERAP
jgi:Flp pilus assembly protein TadD